jgi:hypothetical protein
MPYSAALALLVALLDLIPPVGATLAGALLIVGDFFSPSTALILLVLHPQLPAGEGQPPSIYGLPVAPSY